MKTKFETNVAQEIPKTRMSQEPGLPWKLDPADLEKTTAAGEAFKSATTGAPPLKTRAIFLIMLLAAIFAAVIYFVWLVTADSESARDAARKRDMSVSSLETTLEKINTEKNALSDNLGQLEKRVNELSAQKELFAVVIESLAKKSDETALQVETAAQNTQQVQVSTAPQSAVVSQ